jgi:hypothetical protein
VAGYPSRTAECRLKVLDERIGDNAFSDDTSSHGTEAAGAKRRIRRSHPADDNYCVAYGFSLRFRAVDGAVLELWLMHENLKSNFLAGVLVYLFS